ncbi:MAG: hypothetical protein GY810_29280 [Aureispira sp.]|nr:hypothetical protein [Aureispira sp.]
MEKTPSEFKTLHKKLTKLGSLIDHQIEHKIELEKLVEQSTEIDTQLSLLKYELPSNSIPRQKKFHKLHKKLKRTLQEPMDNNPLFVLILFGVIALYFIISSLPSSLSTAIAVLLIMLTMPLVIFIIKKQKRNKVRKLLEETKQDLYYLSQLVELKYLECKEK